MGCYEQPLARRNGDGPVKKRRGLPRAMVSYSGTVACEPETVRAKDGSELLLVRVVGERQGEPERLAFWVEGRAAEVIRGSAGWKVGDLVQVKLLLVGRAGHEDLSDGRSNELMSQAVRYGNDVAVIREEVRAELLEALGLDAWPSRPLCADDGKAAA